MSEHIQPGRCADSYRQYICGFDGEPFDVTSLNRPDPSWRYTDQQGHLHQWYVDGQPAITYTPTKRYDVPTLTQIVDAPGDDDHPAVVHYECTECRRGPNGVTPPV